MAREKTPKKKTEVPQGISRFPNGKIRVRDTAYMSALHGMYERGEIKPLDISAPIPKKGTLDLHHAENPFRSKRKNCDASVVPLDSNHHMWLEQNIHEERNLKDLFGVWAAFSYYSYRSGSRDGRDFLGYVLECMERDFPLPSGDGGGDGLPE